MEEEKQPVTVSQEPDTATGETKENKAVRKNSPVLIAVVIVLAVALVAVIGALIYLSRKPADTIEDSNAGSSAIVVTEDTRDATQQLTERVAEGMIAVKMTTQWYFADGASEGNCYIANSKANDKPLQVTVKLADTGEQILNAGPIPVGSCIENFKLDKDLPAGTYDAIVTHTQLDEEGEPFNSVQTQISIEISN